MEDQKPKDLLDSEAKTEEDNKAKKSVGQLFGIQLSAPKGMKNPLSVFLILVLGNFLLLYFLGKALGLF